MPLQIRRGTDAERTAMTQPLAAGELIFVSNTNRLFIGNGTTLGGVPVTDYTDEQARDIAASIFVAGTHNSITFAYDDALDKINATVNLSDYQGVIKAAAFNGSVVANDSSLLIDGNTGKFNLSGSVGTDIIPDTDVAYDLGNATYRFRDLYLSGSSIKLGAATITATGTAVNLPAGSTIGGSAIGIPGGDLNVNIVADDSTVIVNTTTEVVTAQGGFVGNVTGNVNGVVTGTAGSSLVGNVTGNVTGNVNGVVTGTAGSSLIGNVIGNLAGDVTGDVKGSVFGDDSSVIVNSIDRVVTAFGGFIGNVTGNVTGTVTGEIFATGAGVNIPGPSGGIFIGTTGTAVDEFDLFTMAAFHSQTLIKPITYIRGRGTSTSPLQVNLSDEIYRCNFNSVASPANLAVSASMSVLIDPSGTLSTIQAPGKITFSTQNNSGVLTEGLSIDMNSVIGLNANQALVAGASSGQVNTASVVSYAKIKVGTTAYAIPLYAIRP